MRHLKSYKIFESSSEDFIGTINDIFIPLSDSETDYIIYGLEKVGLLCVKIYHKSEEVDNCVDHLENYLKDLGYGYFIGRSNRKDEIHISIENNFNKEIEKDFLRIIDGVKEVENPGIEKSTFWVIPHPKFTKGLLLSRSTRLFNQNNENGLFYYDYSKIHSFFESKYNLNNEDINEIVRYLVGKHLKLVTLAPSSFFLNF